MPVDKEYALQTFSLSKHFGKLYAVSEVDLSIKRGEIYAIIGPNGAGKTTLIKMLTGLLSPTRGRVEVFGIDIAKNPILAKETFGYVPDDPSSYNFLTGKEFLAFTGNLRKMEKTKMEEKIRELIELFPLKDVINETMGGYSRGNKQKIAFLAAILSNPGLLIIDEPIVGLDPSSIDVFGKTLKDFAQNGGTVFFATHILPFAKEYAHRVGVMKEGKIIDDEENKGNLSIAKVYNQKTQK